MTCPDRNLTAATGPPVAVSQAAGGAPEGAADSAGEGWPALRLGALPAAKAFPVDVFPELVAHFIEKVSAAIGCPPDFVGLPALVVAGAAVGRTVHLEMKPGYEVLPALYALNIGGPSSGKSPALDAAVRPLWDADERLRQEHMRKVAVYQAEMEAYEAAAKDDKPAKPIKPIPEAAVAEDTTTEALARLLAINPRGLLISRDEGSAWIASLNQYKGGRGADKQFYMSALYGKPIKVDRKGDIELGSIYVREPFLSVVGNLPPDVLGDLQEGGRSDGFFERILCAYPEPVAKPYWSEAGVPDSVKEEWARIVSTLRMYPLPSEVEGRRATRRVQLSPQAKLVWADAYDGHVRSLNENLSVEVVAAENKLADFTGRIILILHMLRLASDRSGIPLGPIPPVAADTVEQAVRLWDYFRNQQHRVQARVEGRGAANKGARLVLNWLKNHPDQDEFSLSDLSQAYPPSRGYDRAIFEDGLKWLAERKAIRPVEQAIPPGRKPGRRPALRWEVHPELRSHLDVQTGQGFPTTSEEVTRGFPESPAFPGDGEHPIALPAGQLAGSNPPLDRAA